MQLILKYFTFLRAYRLILLLVVLQLILCVAGSDEQHDDTSIKFYNNIPNLITPSFSGGFTG